MALTAKDVPFVWRPACTTAFTNLPDALVRAPVLAFPTETGAYVLDTDASNFGLGGVLSQVQNDVECVIAYCSRALRPSQRKYCTTKREMLAAVSMCIQFRSYLRGAKFTIRTAVEVGDQPFDSESVGDLEDADLVPLQSGEDWVAQLDDDLSRPASQTGETFRITALQLQDTTCITLLEWIRSDIFPSWAEVKSLCPELCLCGITGIIFRQTRTG